MPNLSERVHGWLAIVPNNEFSGQGSTPRRDRVKDGCLLLFCLFCFLFFNSFESTLVKAGLAFMCIAGTKVVAHVKDPMSTLRYEKA